MKATPILLAVAMFAVAYLGPRAQGSLVTAEERDERYALASLRGGHCTTTFCGSYTEVSCGPELDGPVWYLTRTDKRLLMGCGGVCWGGPGPAGSKRCTACPPPEWKSCVGPPSPSE